MKRRDLDLLDRGEKLLERFALNGSDRLKRQFDRGDKGALFIAIFDCAGAGIPLHKWAAAGFRDAYMDVKVHLLHASWDNVFGRPHPKKHQKLPARRAKRQKLWLVWDQITELRLQKPGVNHFPQVARDNAISIGVARGYFYDAEEKIHSSDPDQAHHARSCADEARRLRTLKVIRRTR